MSSNVALKTSTAFGLVLGAVFLTIFIQCEKATSFQTQSINGPSSNEYQYTAWLLNAYFIFRDSLPANLYSFPSPTQLYESVHEKWTEYFTPAEAIIYEQNLTTNTGGIGIWFDSVSSGYLIKQVFPNSPGASAGLENKDTITAVNGTNVEGMPVTQFYDSLADSIGVIVRLKILRGSDTLTIPVQLGEYLMPSVLVDSIDGNTAYIWLLGFLDSTNTPGGSSQEFIKALQNTQWAQYTIFDLQGNGGGMLTQCFAILGDLLPTGSPIIQFDERDVDSITGVGITHDTVFHTDGAGQYSNRKLVLLVDSNTASASEITVSCLKQNRSDLKIIGTHTYGKARAQIMTGTPDNGLAKVTYATISPISMPSYDLVGIQPDIPVTGNQNALELAETMIDNGTLAKKQAEIARLNTGIWSIRKQFARKGFQATIKMVWTR